MTRLIGSILGVSFQTELLIMALLGLANSTLDWKPFELSYRLNQIRELDIVSDNEVQLNQNFTQFIKKLLSITVIVEFFCGLITPFAYLLNLYPIITWSRSDILLPWLATHALNTILPKILSVVLIFVFYSENIISTRSLMEFLIVESINLMIACYNWHVFFIFYLDLREVDRRRELRKNQEKELELEKMEVFDFSSETYSSIPNIEELLRETSINYDDFKDLRAVKSLTSLIGNDSQDIDLDDDDDISLVPADAYLSPAEKTMKILHLTEEELEDARHSHKQDLDATDNPGDELHADLDADEEDAEQDQNANYAPVDEQIATVPAESHLPEDLPEDAVQKSCSCSSSDDESSGDDIIISVSKKIPKQNSIRNSKSRKSSGSTRITEHKPSLDAVLFSPTTTMILNHRIDQLHDKNDNLHFLLNRNFELLDKMCRAINFKNQSYPKNSKQKWLIFRHDFESSLDKNMFTKESTSTTSIVSKKSLVAHDNQKEHKLKCKNKNKENHKINNPKIMELNHNNVESITELNENVIKCFPVSRAMNETNTDSVSKSKLPEISNLNRITKRSKSKRPIMQSECMESDKAKELRNLQAYNNLTLEQDRLEMIQKKKKSKMISYKNAVNELVLHNSDIVMSNADGKAVSRTCTSNQSRKRINLKSNCQSNARERKGRNIKQFYKYSEFVNGNSNNNDIPYPLRVSDKMSAGDDDLNNKDTDSFTVEKELKMFDGKALNDAASLTKRKNIEVGSTRSGKKTGSSISTALPQPDYNTAAHQNHRSSIREVIERIDWNIHSRNTTNYASETVNNKSHFVSRTEEVPARLDIVDDETVSMLQSAFSFSDESVRGFRLGPESNEPYPIFQVVTLTIAEIFKATGWRSLTELLPTQTENEIEIPLTEDCIFCGTEGQGVSSRNSGDFNAFTELPRGLSVEKDEVQQRKIVSAQLLEQLQELLESARETLSAVEQFRLSNPDKSQLKVANESKELPPTVFKDLYKRGEKMKNNIKTLETYICTINETTSSSDDTSRGDDINSNLPQKRDRDAKPASKTNLSGRNEDPNLNLVSRKKKTNFEAKKVSSGTKQTTEKQKTQINQVCATKFENRVQIHARQQGEGLSSGNIMEFDSEGRVITSIKSTNTSLTMTHDIKDLKEENTKEESTQHSDRNDRNCNADNAIVDLFESFYRKMSKELENSKENPNSELEQNLRKLAQTQNFSKFMSLFDNEDDKLPANKSAAHSNGDQFSLNRSDTNTNSSEKNTETELKNSEYQSNDNVSLKIKDNVLIQKSFTQELDSHIPTEGMNIHNTTSVRKRNINTSYSSELLKNHRQYLNSSTVIKKTIENWNRDSSDSLDTIGMEKTSKYEIKTISFSDSSDMEEFSRD